MFFFFFIFLVVAICAYWEVIDGLANNTKRKLFLFLCAFFYMLSFLRWEYGPDWDAYYRMYEVYSWDNDEDHEALFSFFIIIGKEIIDHFTFILFGFSTVLFYFQTKGISKMSVLPLTSLFVLTGTYFCNVAYVRQYIAVAIAFYSITYIIQRRFWHYLLLFLIATGFHYSAIAFFPAWWVYHANFSRRKMLIFLGASMFLSSLMILALQGIGQALGGGIAARVEIYLEGGYDYEDGATLSPQQLIIKAIINRGLIFAIGFYLYNQATGVLGNIRNLFNLYCFGSILFFLSCPLAITLTRMSWYYDFVQILIIPAFFVHVRSRQIKILGFLFLVMFLGMKFYLNMNAYEDTDSSFKFIPLIENMLN